MKALIALFSMVMASPLWASPAQDLTRLLQDMHSAEGRFSQTLQDPKGQTLQASEGRFAVKKPGKFQWLTESPFPQQLVSDGQFIWLYDPDLEQASVSRVDDKTAQTPALLLSGDAEQLEQQFDIQAAKGDAAVAVFELTAKAADASFVQISATFNRGLLSRMAFTDKTGNHTVFVFDEVVLNPALSDQQFAFTPPAGTDVIHND